MEQFIISIALVLLLVLAAVLGFVVTEIPSTKPQRLVKLQDR